MGSVTAIVVTWDSARDIGRCLASLEAVEHDAFEILVLDNASSDDTVARVETLLARVGAIESGYATTLEDDERALDEINEAVWDARDERAGNILGLRAGKKRLARRVAELLRELRET